MPTASYYGVSGEEGEDDGRPVWDVMALPSEVVTEEQPPAVQTKRLYPPLVRPAQKWCKFDQGHYLREADTNSTAAKHVTAFLHYLEEQVYKRLGYLYILRDGSLLGSVLLLPLDQTLDQVHAEIAANLKQLRDPFQLLVNDDGRSRWFAMLRRGPDGVDYHIDLTVYPSRLFVPAPIRGFKGDLLYPTRVQAAFAALCRCTYRPLRTNCFDHAEAYLTSIYGDFRVPSKTHAYQNIMEEVYV